MQRIVSAGGWVEVAGGGGKINRACPLVSIRLEEGFWPLRGSMIRKIWPIYADRRSTSGLGFVVACGSEAIARECCGRNERPDLVTQKLRLRW